MYRGGARSVFDDEVHVETETEETDQIDRFVDEERILQHIFIPLGEYVVRPENCCKYAEETNRGFHGMVACSTLSCEYFSTRHEACDEGDNGR